MDKVGVMVAYSDPLCVCVVHCIGNHSYIMNYTHTHTHNGSEYAAIIPTLVHLNGHYRIILVIFSQALYKAP